MAASATRQLPSRTLVAQPTPLLSGPQLLAPRVTPSPCCEPNEVVIELTTTVLVPNYALYYRTPIADFQPSYFALPDGSLTTPVFTQDISRSYVSLMMTAILATIFVRNIIVCFDYLRRANIKRRILFYVLLGSQLFSVGLVPVLVSYFRSRIDCSAVVTVSTAATGISLALLMTGILGLKAYRCLGNSGAVLLVLVAFFCASSAMLVLQLGSIRGVQMLSGGCHTSFSRTRWTQIYVLIQLAHSFFLFCCFFYAVWKSRASPATRGRLSLQVTLEDFPGAKSDHGPRRPWWKQLLGLKDGKAGFAILDASTGSLPQDISSESLISRDASMPQRRASGSSNLAFQRHNIADPIPEESSNSGTPISFSRLIPRMELFYKVMKDELCYTATITATTVVLAICLLLGVHFKNRLDLTCWVGANWAIISLLVIHSFGRVVRRHEREALFQHPSSWWPERENYRSPYSQRVFSSPLRVRVPENPFSDARAISSWNSDLSGSPSSLSPVASIRDRRPSLPSYNEPLSSVDEKAVLYASGQGA